MILLDKKPIDSIEQDRAKDILKRLRKECLINENGSIPNWIKWFQYRKDFVESFEHKEQREKAEGSVLLPTQETIQDCIKYIVRVVNNSDDVGKKPSLKTITTICRLLRYDFGSIPPGVTPYLRKQDVQFPFPKPSGKEIVERVLSINRGVKTVCITNPLVLPYLLELPIRISKLDKLDILIPDPSSVKDELKQISKYRDIDLRTVVSRYDKFYQYLDKYLEYCQGQHSGNTETFNREQNIEVRYVESIFSLKVVGVLPKHRKGSDNNAFGLRSHALEALLLERGEATFCKSSQMVNYCKLQETWGNAKLYYP